MHGEMVSMHSGLIAVLKKRATNGNNSCSGRNLYMTSHVGYMISCDMQINNKLCILLEMKCLNEKKKKVLVAS